MTARSSPRPAAGRRPWASALVADRFAAVLLVVAEVTLLAVLVYAIGEPGAERNHVGFQSAYLVLAAGVAASFLTGDLFNLFVAFEMMLTASYVLLTLGGRREQVRVGHDLHRHQPRRLDAVRHRAGRCSTRPPAPSTWPTSRSASSELPTGVQTTFAVLLLVVFGIKAAVFPLFFWLPDSYPTAPSPITAVFAGLLTKVGVYAIIRTQLLLFHRRHPAGNAAARVAGADDGHRRARRHRPGRHPPASCRSPSSARSATW